MTQAFGLEPEKTPLKTTDHPFDNLVQAQTLFGLNFFKEILKENPGKNVLVSPYSAATAFGMVYNGAAGTTKAAMAQALGLGSMDTAEVNQENADLQESLQKANPKIQLNIANSLWGNKRVRFKPDFLKVNQIFYQAEVNTLDFSKPHGEDLINQWVSDKTLGKIPTIIGPLTPEDILVLVNAVYFKGTWASEFKKEATQPAPFHLAAGDTHDRPTMHQTQVFPYFETKNFQAVRLPCGNGQLNLLVFLPSGDSGLTDFCAGLTPDNWKQWMSQWQTRRVTLALPKFKVEYSQDLIPSMSALGMGEAFDGKKADFKDISLLDPKLFRLYISQALQKTYMLVDEEGTEAAAATAIRVSVLTSLHHTLSPVAMTVDHPFFIALIDMKTKAILFAGAILDPQ